MALVKRIKQAMSEFPEQSAIVSNTYGGCKFRWMVDMAWCFLRYGARPIDYVRFEFHRKSARERNRYLTIFRYFAFNKRMQKGIKQHLSGCKSEEYKIFSSVIKREWIFVDSHTERAKVIDFINKHGVVIAKPDHGEQGHGVMKIHKGDEHSVSLLMTEAQKTPFVMEECLINCDEIAAINPSSLNTIRATTVLDKEGKLHIVSIILRVGREGAYVDNWGSGGIGYNFDVETGICNQYGKDKLNRPYTFHPGSNVQMIGYKLPMFEELLAYVRKLVVLVPEAKYTGWDIAITPKGFDLVEMNCPAGHDMFQSFDNPVYELLKKCW